MAHKMLFNTGVQYHNHCDKNGKLIKGEFDEWKNNQLHIVYYLETEPPKNSRLDYLQSDISDLPEYQVAIKIVGGGMHSDYAIFTIFKDYSKEI